MYKLKIARSYNKICYFRKTSLFSSRKENFLGLPFLSRNLIEAKNTRFPLSVIILGSIFYFHNYGAFSLSCLTRKRGAFCISTKHCFQFGKFSKVLESHCSFRWNFAFQHFSPIWSPFDFWKIKFEKSRYLNEWIFLALFILDFYCPIV